MNFVLAHVLFWIYGFPVVRSRLLKTFDSIQNTIVYMCVCVWKVVQSSITRDDLIPL
jgi:hypothetical protein